MLMSNSVCGSSLFAFTPTHCLGSASAGTGNNAFVESYNAFQEWMITNCYGNQSGERYISKLKRKTIIGIIPVFGSSENLKINI